MTLSLTDTISKLLDKIFGLEPPKPPPPQTNNPAITLPPGTQLVWDVGASSISHDTPCIATMDISTNLWIDPYGGPGAIWTNVMQTTIQAKESLTAPWTNFITLTLWSSSANGRELLVRNGANQNIWTNYAPATQSNPDVLFTTPLSFITSPAKFYRAGIVQQP